MTELAQDIHIEIEYYQDQGGTNALLFRGSKLTLTPTTKDLAQRDWNFIEILSRGDLVEWKINGRTQRTDTAKVGGSPLGLHLEFGPHSQFCRIRCKEPGAAGKVDLCPRQRHGTGVPAGTRGHIDDAPPAMRSPGRCPRPGSDRGAGNPGQDVQKEAQARRIAGHFVHSPGKAQSAVYPALKTTLSG